MSTINYRNLWLVGTSHIARQSVNEIKKLIKNEDPDIIALELDNRRLYALLHEEKSKVGIGDVRHIGFKGLLFALFASWGQKKMGELVGAKPGMEMKEAAKIAMRKKKQIELIDRDVRITLKEFSRRLTWKERFTFVGDIFRFLFFRKREIKRLGIENLDLTKVPEKLLIKKLTSELKIKYPNVYKVLVGDRNIQMANRLVKLMNSNSDKKIMAVVGAGHQEEMIKLISKKIEKQTANEYSFVYQIQ